MDVWLRDGDWRMPVRVGGVLEFFDGLILCGECDAGMLLELIAAHCRIATIISVMQAPPARKPVAPPAPARGTLPTEAREALREKRKSRKPRPSSGAF
jgi:hypothetical protein